MLSAKSSDDDGGSRIVFSSIHCKPPPLSLSLSSLFFVFILIINYYSNTQCNSERKLKPCRSLLTFFLCFSSIIFLSLGPKFVWDPTTSLWMSFFFFFWCDDPVGPFCSICPKFSFFFWWGGGGFAWFTICSLFLVSSKFWIVGCGFLSKNGGACNANWWLLKCFWSELCWVLWNGEREGKGCLLSCVEVVPWGRIFCLFWVEKGCGFCLWKLRFKEELWCLFGSGGWNGMMIERWSF